MGKSRTAHEASTQLFTLPFNLRSREENDVPSHLECLFGNLSRSRRGPLAVSEPMDNSNISTSTKKKDSSKKDDDDDAAWQSRLIGEGA